VDAWAYLGTGLAWLRTLPGGGVLVGFASGFVLFELQEWRRRASHAETLRRALSGELLRVEHVLRTLVVEWSLGQPPTPEMVREMRTLLTEGKIWGDEGLPAVPASALNDDKQLAAVFRIGKAREFNIASEFTAPVLDAVLAAPPPGWSAERLRRLSWVRWQLHVLNEDGRQMEVWLRASTTVPEHNLAIAVANHGKAADGYRRRVPFVLVRVREALADIGRC